MAKIRDFIEQCQMTNVMTEYPKNTIVWARIPKEYQDSDIEVYPVQILNHDSDSRTYEVSYKYNNFKIKYEDVVVSQGQLDQMPIMDSLLYYKVDRDAIDEIISAAVYLNPQATNEELQNLLSRIGLLNEGQVTLSLEPKEVEGKITVPTGDMFFIIEQEDKVN